MEGGSTGKQSISKGIPNYTEPQFVHGAFLFKRAQRLNNAFSSLMGKVKPSDGAGQSFGDMSCYACSHHNSATTNAAMAAGRGNHFRLSSAALARAAPAFQAWPAFSPMA